MATRFEHGVDFGLLVHKSPFMADKRDPLVLSNYIFELLQVNPGVAGFLIQLHPEDVDAVVESVTAHAEKGPGTGSCYQGACSTLHRQVPARHGANSAYPRKKSCSHLLASAHHGGEVDYGRLEDPVIAPL